MPRYTGRKLVTFLDPEHVASAKKLSEQVGIRSFASAKDFATSPAEGEMVLFENIGVAIMNVDPDKTSKMVSLAARNPATIVEPERYVYALARLPMALPLEAQAEGTDLHAYAAGIRDAANLFVEASNGAGVSALGLRRARRKAPETFVDTDTATWGLQATRVVSSKFTGAGQKLAVLDTGLDATHPDFAGRQIVGRSLVPNVASTQDGQGHGTHTAGTSSSAQPTPDGRRYGIASGAELHIGKVLDDSGRGQDGWILQGIDWAIGAGCQVISMSLGSATEPGEPFVQAYETAASRGLARGTLIVAASGNESDRRIGLVAPCGSPANCPSIMAVAAVGPDLSVTYFSSGSGDDDGGHVDIAGPGLNVFSSLPMPGRYGIESGTSMATPHVSGNAALWAEARGASGQALWALLVQQALRLSGSSSDIGSGLVQAPQ
jgi:subtilisin family serine protease